MQLRGRKGGRYQSEERGTAPIGSVPDKKYGCKNQAKTEALPFALAYVRWGTIFTSYSHRRASFSPSFCLLHQLEKKNVLVSRFFFLFGWVFLLNARGYNTK